MDSNSQSRSQFEVSARLNRVNREAKNRAQQHLQNQQAQQGVHDLNRPTVRDQDTDLECTPHDLIDKSKLKGAKVGIKRGGTFTSSQMGTSQTSGDSRDRRQSVSGFNESSHGGSQGHERSTSGKDGKSSENSDMVSGISDDTGGLWGDDSSDSHSTFDRSSDHSMSFYRHASHMSTDTAGFRQSESGLGDRGGGSQAGTSTGGGRMDENPLLRDFIVRLHPSQGNTFLNIPPKEYAPDEFRAWRQEEVNITLSETPVMMLYSRTDDLVKNDDSEAAQDVRRNNERYQMYCSSRRDGAAGGRYSNTGVTTLNDPSMSASCYVQPPVHPNPGMPPIQVTPWKLYDALEKTAQQLAEANDEALAAGLADADATVAPGEDDAASGAASDDEQDEAEGADGEDNAQGGGQQSAEAKQERKKNAWKRSATLAESLMIVERCVVQTIFDELQVLYRGLPYDTLSDIETAQSALTMLPESPTTAGKDKTFGDLDVTKRGLAVTKKPGFDGDATVAGNNATVGSLGFTQTMNANTVMGGATTHNSRDRMKILWRYSDPNVTFGREVSCMAYNKVNPDILAAGYNGGGGNSVIACWSLKNPTAPERVIVTPTADATITSMHFGQQNGSLLAVGSTDGMISLYDVRQHGNAPALKSSVGGGQHTGTIWELRWVDKGHGRQESLISISADGFVKEWSIKKGLERVGDLIRLRRMVGRDNTTAIGAMATGGGKNAKPREALLSRQSGGMCFDMNPSDPMIYVVGTEDGTISKCTKSKEGNTIMEYDSHDEPVYRIRWSPFNSNYFLTCSADWTSRLYHVDRQEPLIKFHDSTRQDPIQDFAWSPHCSTIFAQVTAAGRVELWDIADPLQCKSGFEMSDRSLTSVLFADQESPVITTGDSKGDITVIKLSGIEFERNLQSSQEQGTRLHEVVRKHRSE